MLAAKHHRLFLICNVIIDARKFLALDYVLLTVKEGRAEISDDVSLVCLVRLNDVIVVENESVFFKDCTLTE